LNVISRGLAVLQNALVFDRYDIVNETDLQTQSASSQSRDTARAELRRWARVASDAEGEGALTISGAYAVIPASG
jgi:hypothetical protein